VTASNHNPIQTRLVSMDMTTLRTERLILQPLNAIANATLMRELEQQNRVGRFIGRLSANLGRCGDPGVIPPVRWLFPPMA